MSKYRLGFIGTGNMGGALVRAACRTENGGRDVLIFNRTAARAEALADSCGCSVASDAAQAAREAEFVVLGVKPAQILPLIDALAPALAADSCVLVSMAAGVSLAQIGAHSPVPAMRIMPNTPAASGEGLTLLCAGEGVKRAQIETFCAALAPSGRFDEIPESLFDAAGTLTGCGPAWAYMFMEALADGAVACGVPRAKAMLYAQQMLRGAATHAQETGLHPGALKDAVCSPGGSTIEGVASLEDGAFRASVIAAVRAAYKKTVEMGKGE